MNERILPQTPPLPRAWLAPDVPPDALELGLRLANAVYFAVWGTPPQPPPRTK